MHLNVPKYETTFLIPFKSGNRLLYSTLIELLELNKINYKLSYDTNEFEKDCQLFVRNPIERFFSSYNWFLRMDDAHDLSGKREWTVNEKKNFEKIAEVFHECEINSPSTFISNYIQFINSTDDFHYLPQTSFFITKSDDKGVRANVNFNFRKEYDKFFTGNYRINRIEEIDELIDVNNQILRLSKFNVDFKNKPLPNQELKEFSFLRNFPNNYIVCVISITGRDGIIHNAENQGMGWGFDIRTELINVIWCRFRNDRI